MTILVLATAIPLPVLAQTGPVAGLVFESGGTTGIPNATVELEGHGETLTSAAGTFRFDGVELGVYTLRVDAFGYTSEVLLLAVDGNTTVRIPLEIDPFLLDPLVVEPRAIDIKGRVRDPGRDLSLVDAEVLTNQVPGTLTNSHGRFKIDDVLEGVPLRVIVRAFGYFPVDTILLPDEDESYLFELKPDWLVERMIEVQVGRIEERATSRFVVGRPPMNRERLLRYAGRADLQTAIEFEYGLRLEGRDGCVYIDEKRFWGIGDQGALSLLWTMLPEEVERLEFLYGGGLRIYTREFIQEMIASDIELRPPPLNACF